MNYELGMLRKIVNTKMDTPYPNQYFKKVN